MTHDLFETFRWVKEINRDDVSKVLTSKTDVRMCSNGYKLDKYIFRKEIRKKWSTNIEL